MKLFTSLLAMLVVLAAPTAGAADSADAAHAQALLERAVAHYRSAGEAALAAFHRGDQFREGELYVYVLSTDGLMLSSGGTSSALIGRNLRDLRDTEGRLFIRDILAIAAEKGSGMVEYRWLNAQHGKVERKITYFRAAGNRILATGYYVPRASAEQARSLMWRAAHELKQYGSEALERFNDLNGGFVQDDLYVFVVGLHDRRMHAHGAQPRLVGREVGELTDDEGKQIIRKMIDIAEASGEGELEYRWKNPVTGRSENKRTYLRRVGDYLVAVGAYQP